jgi:hypothetical protein
MRLTAKLAVIVVALGAMALGLLSLRQRRYEVSNEISRAHNRIVEQERAVWRLRADVAARSSPADIRAAAERNGLDLAPIPESTPPERAVGSQQRARAEARPAAAEAKPASAARESRPAAKKEASRARR